MEAKFITAIGTPLTEQDVLHEEGLNIELEDQWGNGIDGILVGGTMGAMQLLTDETYHRLARRAVEITAGRGEVLVGAGDASLARSMERISFLNELKIDGVAVLAPYFFSFGQKELIEYFRALADLSKAPLYLYDLPVVTGTKIELATMLELAKHPNIHGAKVSCDVPFQRLLIDTVGDSFRVIVAQPELVDVLLRHGINEHLDGMWSIAPGWAVAIGRCASAGDWAGAAQHQNDIRDLRNLIMKFGFGVYTDLMNAYGIPGIFAPRPFLRLSDAEHESVLNEPVVQKLCQEAPAAPS